MDVSLAAAARRLAAYDPLGALDLVALREDAAALALRGVAMAQLGDYPRARVLLVRAARGLPDDETPARARCLAALGEVLLARRDLAGAERALRASAQALDRQGDTVNALFVRLQLVRCSLLAGDVTAASRALEAADLAKAPPRVVAVAALVGADVAARRLRADDAHAWLSRAEAAATAARSRVLTREVLDAQERLRAPVARLIGDGPPRGVSLAEVGPLARSAALVVDACRHEVRAGDGVVSLMTRPVLFALARALALAAPSDEAREALILAAFGARSPNASHRARLRVEVGRLRHVLAAVALVEATARGYLVRPRRGARVLVLEPPSPTEDGALMALLAGGESWPTSALAAAVGRSQRTVQRALVELEAGGRVQSMGKGRARRWVAPAPARFATTLLLVARPPPV